MEEEIKRVLSYYDVGELLGFNRIETGFVNDNWRIITTNGPYILKRRHPALQDSDIITAQHQLIGFLLKAGFPAPVIKASSAGETLLNLDGRFYEVQEYIDNNPFDFKNAAHFDEAARTLGWYHSSVQKFDPPSTLRRGPLYDPRLLAKAIANLSEILGQNSSANQAEIIERLDFLLLNLKSSFSGHKELPYLVIHGDYYGGNLLFQRNRIVGVIDYDKARWAPRAAELAEAVIYFSAIRPGHLKHVVYSGFLDLSKFFHFINGYARELSRRRNNLRDEEIAALPAFIRCIWLTVSIEKLLEKDFSKLNLTEAVKEAISLGDWAQAMAPQMIDTCYNAIKEDAD